MITKPKLGISLKLTVGVSLLIVISLTFFSLFIIRSFQRSLLNQVEVANNQLSETIKNSTKYYMLHNSREELNRAITYIAQLKGLEKVRIYNKDGEIKFSSDQAEIDTAVDLNAQACVLCHAANEPLHRLTIRERTRVFNGPSGVRTLGIINPIYNEPGCATAECHEHTSEQKVLGVLDVAMSLNEVDKEIAVLQNRGLAFCALVVVAVSLLLFTLVKRLVGYPVRGN